MDRWLFSTLLTTLWLVSCSPGANPGEDGLSGSTDVPGVEDLTPQELFSHEIQVPECQFDQNDGAPPEVTAVFDLETPASFPFPSNWSFREDPATATGGRLDLTRTNLLIEAATGLLYNSQDVKDLLSRRDGFAVFGPMMLPFTGPLSRSLTDGTFGDFTDESAPVFLVRLEGDKCSQRVPMRVSLLDGQGADGTLTLLSAQPARPLVSASTYLLVATRGLRGAQGGNVAAPEAFSQLVGCAGDMAPQFEPLNCLQESTGALCPCDLVAATVFTTAAVPQGLSELRAWLRSPDSPPRNLELATGPEGAVEAVPPESLDIWPSTVTAFPATSVVVRGAFDVPDLRVDGGDLLHLAGEVPTPTGTIRVPFLLLLPGPEVPGPYPVVVLAHGKNGSKERLAYLALRFGEEGLALAAIDALGHGELEDLGSFDSFELPILRGSYLQSQVDLLAFFEVLEALSTLDVLPAGAPDGLPDLDLSAGMGYIGESMGGLLGGAVTAVEPAISTVVLNVAGGGLSTILLSYVEGMFPSTMAGDVLAFGALAQTLLEVADPMAFAHWMTTEASGKSVLLQGVVDDDTIPNLSTDALALALQATQVCPCEREVVGLPASSAPVSGNALVYFANTAHGFLLANQSNPEASDRARRQAAHFLLSGIRTGTGEVINPE